MTRGAIAMQVLLHKCILNALSNCFGSFIAILCVGLLAASFPTLATAQNGTAPSQENANRSTSHLTVIIHDRDAPNDIHRKLNFILRFMLADSASFIDDKMEYQKRLASLNVEFPEFQSDLKRILTDDNYMDQVVQNLHDTSAKFYLQDEFYRKTIDEDVSKVYRHLDKVIAERPKNKQKETKYDRLIANYETQVVMIRSSIATKHMRLYVLAERLSFLYDAQTAELNAEKYATRLPNDADDPPQAKHIDPIQENAACALGQQKSKPMFFFDYCDPVSLNKKWRFINEYRWMKDEAISKDLTKYNSKLSSLKKSFPEYESQIQRLNTDFAYRSGVIAEFNSYSFSRYLSDDAYKTLLERLVNEAHQKFIEIENHLTSTKSKTSSYDKLIEDSREPILAFIQNKDKLTAYYAYDFFHDVNQFAILVNHRTDELGQQRNQTQSAQHKAMEETNEIDSCVFTPFDFNDEECE